MCRWESIQKSIQCSNNENIPPSNTPIPAPVINSPTPSVPLAPSNMNTTLVKAVSSLKTDPAKPHLDASLDKFPLQERRYRHKRDLTIAQLTDSLNERHMELPVKETIDDLRLKLNELYQTYNQMLGSESRPLSSDPPPSDPYLSLLEDNIPSDPPCEERSPSLSTLLADDILAGLPQTIGDGGEVGGGNFLSESEEELLGYGDYDTEDQKSTYNQPRLSTFMDEPYDAYEFVQRNFIEDGFQDQISGVCNERGRDRKFLDVGERDDNFKAKYAYVEEKLSAVELLLLKDLR